MQTTRAVTPERRSLRLGIDLDGVVADFNRGWMRRYNAQFCARLEPGLVAAWGDLHTHTHFPDARAFWRWASGIGNGAGDDGSGGACLGTRPSIFRDLPPYPGALDALRELDRAGHRVVILSHKPDWAVHDTLAWLAEHRVPTREVHLIAEKASIPCDIYLDDADHNLAAIRRARPQAVVCRYVRPWNQADAGLVDIRSWSDFLTFVRRPTPGEGP